MTAMAGNEIAARSFTDVELANINSFEDAIALLTEAGATPVDVSEYGTGFNVVDKEKLVDVPFVILSTYFREGEYGEEGYCSIEAVTKNNDKVVINDGSTGIREQLRMIISQREKAGVKNPGAGIACPKGLSRSDYYRNKDTGEVKTRKPDNGKGWEPATTFYLAQ